MLVKMGSSSPIFDMLQSSHGSYGYITGVDAFFPNRLGSLHLQSKPCLWKKNLKVNGDLESLINGSRKPKVSDTINHNLEMILIESITINH